LNGTRVDIAIVGAGPAGTTTALCIRRSIPEMSILLIDSADFPRDKACGDAVGPTAVKVYRKLGLETALFAHSKRVSSGRVIGPDGIEFVAGFESSSEVNVYGFIQPRIQFDAKLVQACRSAGVEVRTGTVVKSCVRNGQMWRINLAGSEDCVEAPIVIGADGANSIVRKSLGLASLSGRYRALAIRAYGEWSASSRRLGSEELLVVYEPAIAPVYGWVFPLADGSVNIGVGFLEVDIRKGDPNLKRQLGRFLSVLDHKGFVFENLRGEQGHSLPLGNSKLPIHDNGAFLVGDAAGMINPLSGEGVSYLARAAELIADYLSRVSLADLRKGELHDAERLYGEAFRAEYRRHFKSNYWATRALGRRRIGKLIFRAAERSSATRAYGVDLMFGEACFDIRAGLSVLKGLLHASSK